MSNSDVNDKIIKLQSLFDDLENWNHTAITAGIDCSKLVANIHKSIGKEIVKEKIAILDAEIVALKKGSK